MLAIRKIKQCERYKTFPVLKSPVAAIVLKGTIFAMRCTMCILFLLSLEYTWMCMYRHFTEYNDAMQYKVRKHVFFLFVTSKVLELEVFYFLHRPPYTDHQDHLMLFRKTTSCSSKTCEKNSSRQGEGSSGRGRLVEMRRKWCKTDWAKECTQKWPPWYEQLLSFLIFEAG